MNHIRAIQTLRSAPLPLVALVLTCCLYYPTLSFDFIRIDDQLYILQNPLVLKPDLLATIKLSSLVVSDWTPLVTLLHALEHTLFGMTPVGFRAVHLTLHLISVVLLYLFLIQQQVRPTTAGWVSLIWAVHPLNIETVAWLSSRKNILALIFGLIFLICSHKRAFVGAALALLLALMSKGTAVLFPLLLLALTVNRGRLFGDSRSLLWCGVFLLMAAVRGIISINAQIDVIAQRTVSDTTFLERMSVMGRVFWFQLKQTLLPNDLALMYGWREMPWSEPKVALAWLALLLLLVIGIRIRQQLPEFILGAIILWAGILPTFNLTPAPLFQADRYFHVGLIGAILMIVVLLERCLVRYRGALNGLLALWAASLIYFAVLRLDTWRDTETVWRTMIDRYPRFAPAQVNLANELLRLGRPAEAEKHFLAALAIDPRDALARADYAAFREKYRPAESVPAPAGASAGETTKSPEHREDPQ